MVISTTKLLDPDVLLPDHTEEGNGHLRLDQLEEAKRGCEASFTIIGHRTDSIPGELMTECRIEWAKKSAQENPQKNTP
jgi:hypothetical protein